MIKQKKSTNPCANNRSIECQGRKCSNMRVRQTVFLDREDIPVMPPEEARIDRPFWKQFENEMA